MGLNSQVAHRKLTSMSENDCAALRVRNHVTAPPFVVGLRSEVGWPGLRLVVVLPAVFLPIMPRGDVVWVTFFRSDVEGRTAQSVTSKEVLS